MYQLEAEFNEDVVVQSCLRQNTALENAYKELEQNQNTYRERMSAYKEAEMTRLRREEIHKHLLLGFEEKMKIKMVLDQCVLDEETSQLLKELSAIFEEESRDSDEFVSSLNRIEAEYKNLDTEFDEATMSRKINSCKETISSLSNEVTGLEAKLESLKSLNAFEGFDAWDLTNLRRVERTLNNQIVREDIAKRHSQMILTKNNINFLKEKNAELRTQRNLLR